MANLESILRYFELLLGSFIY